MGYWYSFRFQWKIKKIRAVLIFIKRWILSPIIEGQITIVLIFSINPNFKFFCSIFLFKTLLLREKNKKKWSWQSWYWKVFGQYKTFYEMQFAYEINYHVSIDVWKYTRFSLLSTSGNLHLKNGSNPVMSVYTRCQFQRANVWCQFFLPILVSVFVLIFDPFLINENRRVESKHIS